MTNTRQVTVADMLAARDRRVQRQTRFLEESPVLLCLTMNIPGPVKSSPEIHAAFREGVRLVRSIVGVQPILYDAVTGPEAYFLLRTGAETIKREMCRLEDAEPLGRLFDLDVLFGHGEKLSRSEMGFSPRRCFLCGKPAFECARSRAHSVQELTGEVSRRIAVWQRNTLPDRISEAAAEALVFEAETTPKPGLVDRRNNGSHPDMNLDMLIRSAWALKPYFRECAHAGLTGKADDVFPVLRALGMEAEKTMLHVTGGVNTHKGAIFSMGLLAASAAVCLRNYNSNAVDICALAGRMAAPHVEEYFRALRMDTAATFGDRLFLESGLRGARGEAADGFPSVLRVALPALEAKTDGKAAFGQDAVSDRHSREHAAETAGRVIAPDSDVHGRVQIEAEAVPGVIALLRLAADTDDTTLIRRGGRVRAEAVKKEIRALLDAGLTRERAEALDDRFIQDNLTLGGCADLLACAYFLMAVRTL